MNELFVLNNTFSVPWEASAYGISITQLAERDFYAMEDFEASSPDIPHLRQQPCLYDNRGLAKYSLETRRTWIIFALGLCSSSGIPSIPISGIRRRNKLQDINIHEHIDHAEEITIYRGITVDFLIRILICIEQTYAQTPDALEITVNRFNRFLLSPDTADGLLDLTICLESLIRAETEISWRFALTMVRLNGFQGDTAKEYFDLFRTLYRFRNSYAHGDPAYKKSYHKLLPQRVKLRNASRRAVSYYLTYLRGNSFASWKDHIEHMIVC